jgi:hypothetical protein
VITPVTIDRLGIALAIDNRMRESFLARPMTAIEEYNLGYARRYGQLPIELNDDEKHLVVSLQANSIQQVYEKLFEAVEKAQAKVAYRRSLKGVVAYPDPADWLPAETEISAA